MKKLFVGILLFLAVSVHSQNNFWPVDSLLVPYYKDQTAGVSVLVVKDGKVLYNKQAGYANIEKKQPITDKTVFYLASVSKQFTAACIVLLEQKHKLSLDDQLSKYFPEYSGKNIAIKDLLNHTSGIKDYRALAMVKGDDTADYTNKYLRELLGAQELDFEPGTSFSYSNSGYWYLVQIVEKVSGESIVDFAQKNIFKPLKMKNTVYSYSPNNVKNSAIGYKKENGKNISSPLEEGVIAGSGVLGTAEDLSKWITELDNKKVLGSAFWSRMLDQYTYEFDKEYKSVYSKGLFLTVFGGKKCISHGGDIDGFHHDVTYFPEDKLQVIVLSNSDEVNKTLMYQAAANLTMGFGFKMPKKAAVSSVKVSKDILEKYNGIYDNPDVGAFRITANDGFLNLEQLWDGAALEMNPIDEKTFSRFDINIEFSEVSNDKAQVLNLKQGEANLDFKRNDTYTMPDFTSYTGRFICKSLNVEYDFFIKDGLLNYTVGKGENQRTEISDENTVNITEGTITYQRAADGTANGFILNHERVKNLKFERIN